MINSSMAGCLVGIKWDWSNKISSEQQGVRLSPTRLESVGGDEMLYPNDVVDTRLRMRGTGRTAVVRFTSVPGKDMILLGHTLEGVVRDEGEARK